MNDIENKKCPACGWRLDGKHDALLKELSGYLEKSYFDYLNEESIDEVEWLAGDDSNICAHCQALHGKIFIKTDPILKDYIFNSHRYCLNKHCRCALLPVIK